MNKVLVDTWDMDILILVSSYFQGSSVPETFLTPEIKSVGSLKIRTTGSSFTFQQVAPILVLNKYSGNE